MTHQFNRFSQKYEKNDFEIFLTSAHDYEDVIKGKMVFFDHLCSDGVEAKKRIATIIFYIFNIYDLKDMLPLADCISGDLEYVASAYNIYCNEFGGLGSIAILDEFILTYDVNDSNEEIQIIKCFLAKTIEKLQIIGTGTLLLCPRL